MIDKELIRQAAEDIDLFEDDLSAEFDRLSQPPTRTGNVSPFRGLGGLIAAACIALFLAVGITVRLLTSNLNDTGSLAQAPPTPEGEKDGEGQLTNLTPPRGLGGLEKDSERQLAILPPQPTAFDCGQNAGRQTTRKLAKMQTNHLTPCILTKVKSRGLGGPEKAEEVLQEEDAYSEALLYALITEVEAKAMAEQAEEERLYRTLLEEISTNISKETTQTELTL